LRTDPKPDSNPDQVSASRSAQRFGQNESLCEAAGEARVEGAEGGAGAPWDAEGEAGARGGPDELYVFAARADAAAAAAATEGGRAAAALFGAARCDESARQRPSPLADERLARAAPSAASECGPEKVAEARARYLAAWAGHPRSPAQGHGQGHARQCDPAPPDCVRENSP
jgi:hypothetical protein